MREPRPHRRALAAAEAAGQLRAGVRAGRLDGDAVEAVLGAAGHRAARPPRGPGGPDAARGRGPQAARAGLSNREIGARLVIAPKTAGNHIEHIYAKIGASSRVEASLFAMQNGLLPETQLAGSADRVSA